MNDLVLRDLFHGGCNIAFRGFDTDRVVGGTAGGVLSRRRSEGETGEQQDATELRQAFYRPFRAEVFCECRERLHCVRRAGNPRVESINIPNAWGLSSKAFAIPAISLR